MRPNSEVVWCLYKDMVSPSLSLTFKSLLLHLILFLGDLSITGYNYTQAIFGGDGGSAQRFTSYKNHKS